MEELKVLTEKTLQVFDAENTEELKDKLFKVCINNQKEKFREFAELINYDFYTDHLQKIYQYYEADRFEKGQDYTPKSLARLVSALSYDEKQTICLDMCSGSRSVNNSKMGR